MSTAQVAAAPGTGAAAAPGPGVSAEDFAKKHHKKHAKKKGEAGKKPHKQELAAGAVTAPHGAVQGAVTQPSQAAGTFTPATAGRKLMD